MITSQLLSLILTLLLTRYSELSLEAVMGSSPTRLPVLNVSRAATGAMAVEVRRAAERLPYP